MLFRGLLTQLPTVLAVSWLQGKSHFVFLCRPPLSPRVLLLTSLAGVLSQMSHEQCPGRVQSDRDSPLAPFSSCSPCCLNLPHLPSATSLQNHPPPQLLPPVLSIWCHHTFSFPCLLHTTAHLASCLWAVLLWAALTPSLLDGHSEKRDIVPLRHWRKLRPPKT